MKPLVDERGYYHARGSAIWVIGKLMEINDLLCRLPQGGKLHISLDTLPALGEVAKMIEAVHAQLDEISKLEEQLEK